MERWSVSRCPFRSKKWCRACSRFWCCSNLPLGRKQCYAEGRKHPVQHLVQPQIDSAKFHCQVKVPERKKMPRMKWGVKFVTSTIQFELALTHNSSELHICFESTLGIFFTTRASRVGVRTKFLPRDDLGSGTGGAWGVRKRVRIWGLIGSGEWWIVNTLKWVSLKCSLLSFLALGIALYISSGSKKPIWIIFRSNFVAMALTFSVSTVNGTTYDISCSEADTVHALRINLETNHIEAAWGPAESIFWILLWKSQISTVMLEIGNTFCKMRSW